MSIDRMLSRLDLARQEDYSLFLNVHYSTLRELSPDWRDTDRDEFLVMAHCLQEDLRSLGSSPSPFEPAAQGGMSEGARLGVSYIIRGSRYEAMSLRHRVPPHYGASYLDFSPLLSWPRFLEQLEQHVVKITERDETLQVISGARSALARFTFALTKALA